MTLREGKGAVFTTKKTEEQRRKEEEIEFERLEIYLQRLVSYIGCLRNRDLGKFFKIIFNEGKKTCCIH